MKRGGRTVREEIPFKINQLVLTKVFASNKLEDKFKGPFNIIEIDYDGFKALVQDPRKKKWESFRNIKPFYKEEVDVVNTSKKMFQNLL